MTRGSAAKKRPAQPRKERTKREPPPPLPTPAASVRMPMTLANASNGSHGHWTKKAGRAKGQRPAVAAYLRLTLGAPPPLPLVVSLTRISPRPFDDDGAATAFKAVRDGVADWLGVADNREGLRFSYRQERGAVREHAVRIDVYPNATECPACCGRGWR